MGKNDKSNAEKTFNAVAKQFFKYGGEHLKPEDKFQVKESDVRELSQYAEIEIPEEEIPPVNSDGKEGEKEGE